MAIEVRWDAKCGEAVVERTVWNPLEGKDETELVTLDLYQGNAYLVFIAKWKDGEKDMRSLWLFFNDREHMKNCLGLTKQNAGDNILNTPECRLVSISLDKNRNAYVKQITAALIQAFDNLEIKIYSSKK